MVGTLGDYTIERTLGKGASCKVKLARHSKTGQRVAIKIMDPSLEQTMVKLVMTEIKAMSGLKHVNVINQVEYGKAVYVKKSGKELEVNYIVLELAFGGELWDYLANTGRFDEKFARYFFRQLLDGLDYCHL